MFRLRRVRPVTAEDNPHQTQRPVVECVAREDLGGDPYDSAPDPGKRASRKPFKRTGRSAVAALDPYATATKQRSWDDALIDTGLSHRRGR